MRAYRLEVLVIDFDDIGSPGIVDAIVNARYPNRCISPDVISVDVADIGEWDDDHPLNSRATWRAEVERLFPSEVERLRSELASEREARVVEREARERAEQAVAAHEASSAELWATVTKANKGLREVIEGMPEVVLAEPEQAELAKEAARLRQRLKEAEAERDELRAMAGLAPIGHVAADALIASLKRELAAAQAARAFVDAAREEFDTEDADWSVLVDAIDETTCDGGTAALDSYVADATAALRERVAELEAANVELEAANVELEAANVELEASVSSLILHGRDAEAFAAGIEAARSEGERVGEERERERVRCLAQAAYAHLDNWCKSAGNGSDGEAEAWAVMDKVRGLVRDIETVVRPSTKEEDGHG